MGGTSKLMLMLTSPLPLLYPRPSTLRLILYSSRVSAASFSSLSKRRFLSSHPSRLLDFPINSSFQDIHTHTSRNEFYADPPLHSSISGVSHPWPEWSNLLDNLRLSGYFDRQVFELNGEDALAVFEELPEEFVRAASACLSFARQRSHLLGSLSRKDIEVIVENGSPFLFKSAMDSSKRMKSFLGSNQNNEFVAERPHMVDLMRYILSYVYNPAVSDRTNLSGGEFVESSVRNLLRVLAYESGVVREPDLSSSMSTQFPDGSDQASRPLRQNIEMKRGDWICTKCSFMNFARNRNCLECNELRPTRHLTGGEWHCPQCDFFNYGKNILCLRCDCKCPGEVSGIPGPRFGLEYNNENKGETLNSRIALPEQRMANSGIPEGNTIHSMGPRNSSGASVSKNLDRILGRTSEGSNSEYVPFKPLPPDMFNKTQKPKVEEQQVNQAEGKEDKEQEEKSERWFKKVAELHDVTDLASAISDEDFPEIMPMRKGENRFVVSKKKDRSLTSPPHKRRMAMEQTTNTTNFVPFVPFPPDYFAKKNKELETEASAVKDTSGSSASATSAEQKPGVIDSEAFRNSVQPSENLDSRNAESKVDYSYGKPTGNLNQTPNDLPIGGRENRSGGASWEGSRTGSVTSPGNSTQQPENAQSTGSWKGGFSGKSLEGSLVKEPDPLDMSEEAKAERWFRRAAQIKDISELSQIPDEDFPSIMPMRKGVNRFVVSKRKTPLERRLTSPQYRRNLPTVSSEPVKKDNTES